MAGIPRFVAEVRVHDLAKEISKTERRKERQASNGGSLAK
jgi:hypothetical protein